VLGLLSRHGLCTHTRDSHCPSSRKTQGTLLTASVSQYPQLWYEYVGALQWDKAIRLCRHVRDRRVNP